MSLPFDCDMLESGVRDACRYVAISDALLSLTRHHTTNEQWRDHEDNRAARGCDAGNGVDEPGESPADFSANPWSNPGSRARTGLPPESVCLDSHADTSAGKAAEGETRSGARVRATRRGWLAHASFPHDPADARRRLRTRDAARLSGRGILAAS